MIKRKKCTALMLAAVMTACLCLTGCGDRKNKDGKVVIELVNINRRL